MAESNFILIRKLILIEFYYQIIVPEIRLCVYDELHMFL